MKDAEIEKIVALGEKAYKQLPAIRRDFPEDTFLKMTEYNQEFHRVQPFAILFMVEMNFFSSKALRNYLRTTKNEDYRAIAQKNLGDMSKMTDSERTEKMVKAMMEAEADSHTRYFSFLLRAFHAAKKEHIDSRMFADLVRRKSELIRANLRKARDEDMRAQEEVKKQNEENEVRRKHELRDWFEAARSRPNYVEELKANVKLIDPNLKLELREL